MWEDNNCKKCKFFNLHFRSKNRDYSKTVLTSTITISRIEKTCGCTLVSMPGDCLRKGL